MNLKTGASVLQDAVWMGILPAGFLMIRWMSLLLYTDIVSDLGADSLDVVEMLMSLEDEYGITIEDDKVAEMKTVADVVRCVEGLIEG